MQQQQDIRQEVTQLRVLFQATRNEAERLDHIAAARLELARRTEAEAQEKRELTIEYRERIIAAEKRVWDTLCAASLIWLPAARVEVAQPKFLLDLQEESKGDAWVLLAPSTTKELQQLAVTWGQPVEQFQELGWYCRKTPDGWQTQHLRLPLVKLIA